jgi:uncharacterized protein (TIGR02145 family)
MKKIMLTWDTFGISKNSVIFHALVCSVFVVIILCGGCSDSGIGTVVSEVKIPAVPPVPSEISATATSSSSVAISWLSVSQATGYNVYRCTNINDCIKVGRATSTTYTNTGLSSGTLYYYRATAYNSGGESPLSSSTPVTTIPAMPLSVSAAAASSGDITVRWSSVYGAIGYKIFRGTSIDGPYEPVYTTSDTSYTDTGLLSGTIYYYKISAYNNSGESSLSSLISTKTRPIAPSNVSAIAAGSSGSITVSWSLVNDVMRYIVYRGASAYGTYDSIYTTSDTLYTNTGLSSGDTYFYKVSSYNSAGESPLSSYASATTVPAAPSDVSATATSSNSIILGWSSVRGATGYIVYRSRSANGTYDSIYTTSDTLYTNTELSSGATYYYKVSAYNGSGKGPLSAYDSAAIIPLPPSDVSATATSSGNITVGWPSVYGATGYKIYRGISDDGPYDLVYTTSSTSYTDVELILGTTYYYKVSAVNSGGESLLSEYDSATPFLEYMYGTFTDDRDGKTYNTIKIGDNKTWMAGNLNYETVNDSWCYNNDESMCSTYGKLYNWTMAMSACPDGWRLPSRQEWVNLVKTVGGTGTYGDGGTAGTKLKSNTGWNHSSGVPDATDDYGFSALPGGNHTTGGFSNAGTIGYWWTATDGNNGKAYYRSMKYNSEGVSDDVNDKSVGMSVRCVQE